MLGVRSGKVPGVTTLVSPDRPRYDCLSQARPPDTACLLSDAIHPCNMLRTPDKRAVSPQRVARTSLLTELLCAVRKTCVKSLQ